MKRNNLHIFIGACLGYALTMLFGFPNRDNFPNDFRLFLTPIVACVPTYIIAWCWEKRQAKKNNKNFDINDVARTVFASYFGGLLAMFFANFLVAIIWAVISAIITYIDFKKNKL